MEPTRSHPPLSTTPLSPLRALRLAVGFVLITFGMFALTGLGPVPVEFEASAQTEKVQLREEDPVVYKILGMIDSGLESDLTRDVDRLVDEFGAKHLVFYIDTDGGALDAAIEIAEYIYDLSHGRGVQTYAFVPPRGRALSAGALIAFACTRIYMGTNSKIGDVAPVTMNLAGGVVEQPEKIQTLVRSHMTKYAQDHGYPVAIAEAMVSKRFEVYQLRGGDIDGERFVTKEVLENYLRTYGETRRRELSPRLISPSGSLLTLTERQAQEYRIIPVVVDRVEDFTVADLRLSGPPLDAHEDLGLQLANEFGGEAKILMKNFLTNGFTRFLLVTAGIVLVAVELMFPIAIWGILSIACFALYFVGGYLDGTVQWVEVVLFVISGILIGLEVFVIPGFGVAGVLGLGCLFASLVMALREPGEFTLQTFYQDTFTTVSAMAAGIVLMGLLFVLLPKARKSGGLISAASLSDPVTTPASGTTTGDYGFLLDKHGVVSSALRPSGRVQIEDQDYDVVAEGSFIDRGVAIVVCEVHGNRIVVRPLEEEDVK